jgi:hypothetical protein
MSLGSLVTRLLIGFIMLVVLGIAGGFTYIFAIVPIGMAAGSCPNGASDAANFYTSVLGVSIALGAIVPPALIVFLKRWYWTLITLGLGVAVNALMFSLQFWLPFSFCK